MPFTGEAVPIVTTPNGTTGCTTNKDGITITTELQRDGTDWRAGTTWIEGQRVAPGQVHDTRAAAAEAAAARSIIATTEEAGKKLQDVLR